MNSLTRERRESICRSSRRLLLRSAGVSICLLLVALSANAIAEQPNFVLIVADDLGYGDVACYGAKENKTPHIDALAAAGVRFTDFHSAGPMCTPTRAAMLTGQYQQRFGRKFDGPLSGLRDQDDGLPHQAVTIAEILKQQGYATACYGKWHLGYQPPWLPPNHGFDEFRGIASGDGDFHTHISRWGQEDWWHDNKIEMETGYTTQLLTRHSVDFIERHRDRPFFLYVPHLAIHFPWQGPKDPPHRQRGTDYTNDKWGVIPEPGNVRPHVRAMIESLDDSVGQIRASLKKWNLDRKTVLIFTSDNGGYLTYGRDFRNISSNGPLRGQKGNVYEGGHRVPMIVCWPETMEPAVTRETGHSTDLLPTLASMAGMPTDKLKSDGVNLTPLLLRQEALPKRMLFWRIFSLRAVRSGPWKLCFPGNDQPGELYNLDDDLGEQHNVADQHANLVKQLDAAWSAWNADVNESAERVERQTE